MDLTIGACSRGKINKCFDLLKQGLIKKDRDHVHLVIGNGGNGFNKGEFGFTVDQDYKSNSKNFQTLQKLSGDHSAMGIIDVLGKGDTYTIKTIDEWDITGKITYADSTDKIVGKYDPFAGYTFFQYRGKDEDGIIYTTGNYSKVVINTMEKSDVEIIQTIYEELRHLFIGAFGRTAQNARHSPTYNFDGIPKNDMDKEAVEANEEAKSNARH
jgi:hypothetical protein